MLAREEGEVILMPEMSEENYSALVERLAAQDKKIEGLEKRIADISAMNKVLLQTSDDGSIVRNPTERHEELDKKLKGALFHA